MRIKPVVFLLFGSIFALYFHNVIRDIFGGDIGDLTTASCIWGVAHPSGYPLFTVLGGILCHLPLFWLPQVSRVALVSVFSSLIGLIYFYKFTLEVTKKTQLAILSTLILAFSYYFWFFAEIPEVFGLNNALIIIILYYSISFYQKKQAKDLYLTALFCGLAVAHHHSIVFLFAGVALLFLRHIKLIFSHKKTLLYSIGLFVLGSLVYIYVPLAASHNPPINWDSVTNLDNFMHLFFLKNYNISAAVLLPVNNLPLIYKLVFIKRYFVDLLQLYSYPIFFIMILGFYNLLKKQKFLAFSLLIAFLLSGPYFIFIATPLAYKSISLSVVERFFVTSTTIVFFFIPYGFLEFEKLLKKLSIRKQFNRLIMVTFFLIPVLLILKNMPKTDMSKIKIGNTFAEDILSNTPKNAILSLEGDTSTFNIWYVYHVLHYRNDILLINPPFSGGGNYVDKYISDFNKRKSSNSNDQSTYNALIDLQKARPIYTTYITSTSNNNLILLPRRLVFEVVDKKKLPSKDEYIKQLTQEWNRSPVPTRNSLTAAESNLMATDIPYIYSQFLVHTANFISNNYQDPKAAIPFFHRALTIDNQNQFAYEGLAVSLYESSRNCRDSVKYIEQAHALLPLWQTFYIELYLISKQCGVNQSHLDQIARDYHSLFRKDITKVIK